MLNKHFMIALLLAPVVLLSGCGWFGSKKAVVADQAGGTSVVSFDGKSVITLETLEKDFEMLLDENPQLRQILVMMPDAKMNFLRGMTSQAVVDEYIERKGVSDTAEYKKKMDDKMRNVKRMLNIEYFGKDFPAQVSDADAKKFYEDNKDKMPDLMISRGGVKAAGVSFSSEAKAKEFLKKVEPKNADLSKMAQAENFEVRDFKVVNAQSVGIPAQVRDAIVDMKVPSAMVVKADNHFWVVKATAKEDAQYHPYENVKEGIKQYLEKDAQMKRFEQEIERLKKEYNVVINEELVSPAAAAPGVMTEEDLIKMSQEEEPVAAAPAAQKSAHVA